MPRETSSAEPTPSPIPHRIVQGETPAATEDPNASDGSNESATSRLEVPSPKLRLHVQDITHRSATTFFRCFPDPEGVLHAALSYIVMYLYASPKSCRSQHICFTPSLPPTRSVTLILRDFSGVAHTTSIDLDVDHKEIHLSLAYIAHSATLKDPIHELVGVLTHEMVHCYQHTCPPGSKSVPSPPSGLIEGIADFVRLKAGLSPPHWHRPLSCADLPDSWDRGYQDTAFFLEWLEDVKVGTGAVGLINDRLLRTGYVGENNDTDASCTASTKSFWRGLFGASVQELWVEYRKYIDGQGGKRD
ncbi:hypothetical protein LOZ57_004194 [Ophidiomyces ophidiicola]|uniref:uncharacterized protein n=1 Tax=Ophidiomyces ophidiicola TaxID=1387563 RepID=UPI0020C51699|nr:uncharacterized protein LOZ57_004194 [Ophidiomyces ophidiicola]KAI1945507.1 hypothetical protein LOZ57_004194 [Ophidiomyces ophidiicola]KAI2063290.1 hypothetical protein LOZ43_000045 [Ophidiomyces ophidiicola]